MGSLLCHSLPSSLETGSLAEPGARLGASKPQGSSCGCPQAGLKLKGVCIHAQLFIWVLGIQKLGSARLPTEH